MSRSITRCIVLACLLGLVSGTAHAAPTSDPPSVALGADVTVAEGFDDAAIGNLLEVNASCLFPGDPTVDIAYRLDVIGPPPLLGPATGAAKTTGTFKGGGCGTWTWELQVVTQLLGEWDEDYAYDPDRSATATASKTGDYVEWNSQHSVSGYWNWTSPGAQSHEGTFVPWQGACVIVRPMTMGVCRRTM